MTRAIEEIRKCKYEIEFYRRQLENEAFRDQWDASEWWLNYWEKRLGNFMKSRNTRE